MPCNGDYMQPNKEEIIISDLLYLIDEIENGKPIDKSRWNKGYHPSVYCMAVSKFNIDELTAKVCKQLQELGEKKIKTMSLELQTWWRDHQEADKRRLKHERFEKKKAARKKAALAKLTPYERRLLGH